MKKAVKQQTVEMLRDVGKSFEGVNADLASIFQQLAIAELLGNLPLIARISQQINLAKAQNNPFIKSDITEITIMQ